MRSSGQRLVRGGVAALLTVHAADGALCVMSLPLLPPARMGRFWLFQTSFDGTLGSVYSTLTLISLLLAIERDERKSAATEGRSNHRMIESALEKGTTDKYEGAEGSMEHGTTREIRTAWDSACAYVHIHFARHTAVCGMIRYSSSDRATCTSYPFAE